VSVVAQIDTGSPYTVVRTGTISHFDLTSEELIPVWAVASNRPIKRPRYPLAVCLLDKDGSMLVRREMLVVEMELPDNVFSALIGRDLLADGFFRYCGPKCAFELAF